MAVRRESGYSIFARASDPVSRYIIEIDQFRVLTSSLGSENTMRTGGSSVPQLVVMLSSLMSDVSPHAR